MPSEISCKFRHSVHSVAGKERATCGLLQKLLAEDLEAPSGSCEVSRDACAICSQSLPVVSDLVAGPFASILSNACDQKLDNTAECSDLERASALGETAEEAILEADFAPRLTTCDVVILCDAPTKQTHHAIDSALQQQRAETIVHLVLPTGAGQVISPLQEELMRRYESRSDVHIHHTPEADTPLRAVHEIVAELRSEFVALQHLDAYSLPTRITASVNELRRLGADFIGSPMQTASCTIDVQRDPGTRFEYSLPWPTLVFRRATFIDLGGVAERQSDADVELLFRARACGAKVASLPWNTVELEQHWQPTPLGKAPEYSLKLGSLRHHALDFPKSRIKCDVVLPIFGQLEFAGPAIESVIEQLDAECVVHLIDDCGPEDVSELFRYWQSHPRVRLYKNTRNIGQYTSFNNVSEFFETDLVAVQDGDDLSLPHRLSLSGNLLELSGADYFAAAMEQFGASEPLPNRRSRYPHRKHSPYFALNPTACFRVSMFRSLGGYTDFGAHERNRGGLDSEFMNRAYYSERRFAISTSIVTKRRVHPQAATQRTDTGFGSPLREQAIQESRRRVAMMQKSRMDPRFFGGLGNHRNLTQRLTR